MRNYKAGIFAKGKRTDEKPEGFCVLKEESESYNADFSHKNEVLSTENAFFWNNKGDRLLFG